MLARCCVISIATKGARADRVLYSSKYSDVSFSNTAKRKVVLGLLLVKSNYDSEVLCVVFYIIFSNAIKIDISDKVLSSSTYRDCYYFSLISVLVKRCEWCFIFSNAPLPRTGTANS